jgi:ABC-type multidrug transport system fused ATPase/permease subunit
MNSMETAPAASPPVPAASRDADPHGKLTEKVLVRELNFYYGDHRALKTVNVPLYDRKVTAFIGPSGCGKSTLLRVLNRIYDLYPNQRAEGEVLLDGHNIGDVTRPVAFPQRPQCRRQPGPRWQRWVPTSVPCAWKRLIGAHISIGAAM